MASIEYNYQIIRQAAPAGSEVDRETSGHWLSGDLVFNYFAGNVNELYVDYFIENDVYGTFFRRLLAGANISYMILRRWVAVFSLEYQQYQAEYKSPIPGRESSKPLNRTYTYKGITEYEFYSESYAYLAYEYFVYLDGETRGYNSTTRTITLGITTNLW